MTDPEEHKPHPDDDALEDVESLGGDDEIMESLPPEGSPINGESDYDSFDADGVFDDGEAHDYSADDPQPLDVQVFDASDTLTLDADSGDSALLADAEPAYATQADAEYEVAEPYSYDAYTDDTLYTVESDDSAAAAYDFVDIEAALASVATLGDLAAEREQAEIAEQVAIDAAQQAEEERRRPLRRVDAPPMLVLRRGQLASVVPAIALIVFGGWLTFAVTAPNAVPVSPVTIILAAAATILVTLFAFWLASGRWSRGVLFFILLVLLTTAALYYDSTLDLSYSVVGPLVLAAAGLAFALAGLLARPMDRRYLLPAILLLAAAGVNVAVAIGYLPDWLLPGAAAYWPVLVAVVVVLWLLPAFFKRRA